jgi:hypothetical protein
MRTVPSLAKVKSPGSLNFKLGKAFCKAKGALVGGSAYIAANDKSNAQINKVSLDLSQNLIIFTSDELFKFLKQV